MTDSLDVMEKAQVQMFAERKLRSLETKYFSEIEPVSSIEVSDDPTTASCYVPATKSIKLNYGVARFQPLAEFLILHELVHHKLFMQDPRLPSEPLRRTVSARDSRNT
jgi:hypothetical protein